MKTKAKNSNPTKSKVKGTKAKAKKLTFGKMLLSIRLDKEMSQKEMADHLEMTRQELCNIEKGRKSVSLERAAIFAKRLRQPQKSFVKHVLQDHLHRAGLKGSIEIRK